MHRTLESGSGHADQRNRNPVDLESLTEDTGIAAEATFPIPVRDDSHRGGGHLIVRRCDRSTDDCRHSKAREVRSRNQLAECDRLGFTVNYDIDLVDGCVGEHLREGRMMVAESLQGEQGKRGAGIPAGYGVDGPVVLSGPRHPPPHAFDVSEQDEFARILDRQRPKEDVIHQTENGDIGADAEGQRPHHRRRKAWVLDELPHGESELSHGCLRRDSGGWRWLFVILLHTR